MQGLTTEPPPLALTTSSVALAGLSAGDEGLLAQARGAVSARELEL